MNVDEQGRLRVAVEGVNIYTGGFPLAVYNGIIVLSTASQLLNFSPSFTLSTPDNSTIYVSASFGQVGQINTYSFAGTSSLLARSDHIHSHGNLSGSFLHSLVSNTENGFMSSGSYILLNSLSSSITQSLSAYQLLSQKNQPNGYVGLDAFGKISNSFLSGSNLLVYNSASILTSNALSLNFVGFTITSSTPNNILITNNLSGSVGNVFEAYQTSSQGIANAPLTTNIKFDVNRLTNPNYTKNIANDTITFNVGGTYKIEYGVSIANSVNNESSAMSALFLNGNAISGSYGYSFHRSSTSGTTKVTGQVVIQVAINDTIQLRTQRNSGAGTLVTVANGTNIIITRWI